MLCPDWSLPGPLLALWPFRMDVWRDQARPIQRQLTDFLVQVQAHQPVLMGVHPRELSRASRFLPASIQTVPLRYNDAWPRDIGPVWTQTPAGIQAHDFQFSAWNGLYPNMAADQTFVRELCARFGWRRQAHQMVLEGGAVSGNGDGVVCWSRSSIERNNGLSGASSYVRDRLQKSLEKTIHATHHLWFNSTYAADETGGHVDNMAQFLAPDLLAIDANVLESDAATLAQLPSSIKILELPPTCSFQPRPNFFSSVQRSPGVMRRGSQPLLASYVNFVRTPTAVFVPQFGRADDAEAVRIICSAVPHLAVVPVVADEMIAGGGGPHCMTLPLPLLHRPA